MTHQMDRLEEMLQKLVDDRASADHLRRDAVARLVIELFGFMLTNKKIEAIKYYRMLTGHGLKESKDAICTLYEVLSKKEAA